MHADRLASLDFVQQLAGLSGLGVVAQRGDELDRLAQLPALLRFTRRARQVVIACFALSIVYNAAGLSLALSGMLTPLVTAILMPVSSLTILALGSGGMRWYARELTSAAGRDGALGQTVAAGASA